MSEIRRTDNGGSIVTFIIVSVILVIGLVGSVYYLNQHSIQVRKEQAIAAAEQQKINDSLAAANDNNAIIVDDSKDSTQIKSDLPATGSDLSINNIFGSGFLVMATVGYFSSRRKLIHSL